MTAEEYLQTSFEDGEREFLDGRVVERNTGDWVHALTLGTMIGLLGELEPALGICVLPIIRIRFSPTRYRVPDIAVWRDRSVGGDRIPRIPPFLAIEILSPRDRIIPMCSKIQEFLEFGVEYVWAIEPEEQAALVFSQENRAGKLCDVLRTENPAIEIPLAAAFDPNA